MVNNIVNRDLVNRDLVKENIISEILTPRGSLADEIDLLLKDDNHLLASECKFTNKVFDQSDMNELIDNAKTLNIPDIEYYIFVKKAVDKKVYEQHAKMHCIYLEDLYK